MVGSEKLAQDHANTGDILGGDWYIKWNMA